MSLSSDHRVLSPLDSFDPLAGVVIKAPEREEPGYWVGCAGVLYEQDRGRFLLTYRERRPRGAEPERGWRCAVAESIDGVHFTDIWSVTKDQLETPSMERFSVLPTADGRYRLYLSYVDPVDNRWRIDVVEAATPGGFDLRKTEAVLTADSTGTEGVKDPYVLRVGPVTYLFASFAERGDFDGSAHDTADIYNAGVTTHPTGLATSVDGRTFHWYGSVLEVGEGWDGYQARLNSIVRVGGTYVGFYDGSSGAQENYEERCGIAVSHDLKHWDRLTASGPWVVTPHGTGSVRYLDALLIESTWWLYYEITRPDGAHELRLARIPAS